MSGAAARTGSCKKEKEALMGVNTGRGIVEKHNINIT